MKTISIILAALFIAGCVTAPVETAPPAPIPAPTPDPVVVGPTPEAPKEPVFGPVAPKPERIALSWEAVPAKHWKDGKMYYGKPEWSDLIVNTFKKDLALYSGASDVVQICPRFHSLSEKEKLHALGEFWVAVAYHESNYKPTDESVDVGTQGDKGSWSVGLYQMSANDTSAKEVKVTYEMLKEGEPNILVAMTQLKKQITKKNAFFLQRFDPMRYWAVILLNGKYQKIDDIKSRVKKNAAYCL